MKRIKIDKREPADRPLMIALSVAEVIALANYHVSEAKLRTRRFGKAAMELSASPLPKTRALRDLHAACGTEVAAHHQRARGILALAQEFALKEAKEPK